MKIIDTNILNRFARGEISLDLSEEFYITEDLKNEIENLKSISLDYKNKINQIVFNDIENHHYFNEAKYLENYQKFINKYNKIVSFYGLKGLGDISIIASVATIINPANPTLFANDSNIEVITNDNRLTDALIEEFDKKISINDNI